MSAAKARDPEDSGCGRDSRGARAGVIVVDASALLEFLLQTERGTRVEARLFRDDDELHAPHLVDVEVVQGRLTHEVRAYGSQLLGRGSPDREDRQCNACHW